MPHVIKINDLRSSSRVLAFDLKEFTKLIPAEGESLTWSILGDVWIMERHRGKTKELRQLSRRVDRREYKCPGGLMLSWNELVDYAQMVMQTVDGIYAGFQEASQALRYEGVHKGSELYDAAEIVLEAHDSSFWLVYAKDERIIERLQSVFQDTELLQI